MLLPVPQVVFLSGRQIIGCPRMEGGHAPSHADADESVAYRRFGSHVVSIAHIFSILWTLHHQAHAVDDVLVPSRDLLLLLLVPPIPQLLVEALRVHVDVRALHGRVEVLHQHVLVRIGGVEEGLYLRVHVVVLQVLGAGLEDGRGRFGPRGLVRLAHQLRERPDDLGALDPLRLDGGVRPPHVRFVLLGLVLVVEEVLVRRGDDAKALGGRLVAVLDGRHVVHEQPERRLHEEGHLVHAVGPRRVMVPTRGPLDGIAVETATPLLGRLVGHADPLVPRLALPAVHLRHVPVGPLLAEVCGVDVPELVEERLGDEEGQQAFAGVRAALDDEEHLILRLPGHRSREGPEHVASDLLGAEDVQERPLVHLDLQRLALGIVLHRALLQKIHVRVVVHEPLGLAAVHAVAEGYLPEGRVDDLVVEGGDRPPGDPRSAR